MQQLKITDDLDILLEVLPASIRDKVKSVNRGDALLEVVLDLGRNPEARYIDGELNLSDQEVAQSEINHVVDLIGEFDADNRAGLERTLHRISAIRNRRGDIVGLTCRVGRAVYGTIDIIEDIVMSGKSILLLGKPGVGKTTMLREAARVLAEKRRVIVVDTSNEIGGDGDIPHPAVGRARRMQVPQPSLQHEVMIEAVENHMPETIVIDEIGRELEALAARTIAERGVQLVATAHGNTLDNLLLNPTLSDLVGGIESVTLSDEEARRRGTQKTVLERRAPPTFDMLIEIQDRQKLLVHHDVAQSVDSLLRGRAPDEGAADDAGEPPQRRCPGEKWEAQRRQPRDVAQDVLGDARDQEQEEEGDPRAGRVQELLQALDTLPGEQGAHERRPGEPGSEERNAGPRQDPDHRQRRSLPGPEDVAPGDLRYLARDDEHHDLQRLGPHEGERREGARGVDPLREALPGGKQVPQLAPPDHHGHHEGRGQQREGDEGEQAAGVGAAHGASIPREGPRAERWAATEGPRRLAAFR